MKFDSGYGHGQLEFFGAFGDFVTGGGTMKDHVSVSFNVGEEGGLGCIGEERGAEEVVESERKQGGGGCHCFCVVVVVVRVFAAAC